MINKKALLLLKKQKQWKEKGLPNPFGATSDEGSHSLKRPSIVSATNKILCFTHFSFFFCYHNGALFEQTDGTFMAKCGSKVKSTTKKNLNDDLIFFVCLASKEPPKHHRYSCVLEL